MSDAARQPRSSGKPAARLADLVAAPAGPGFHAGFPPETLAKIGALAALLVALHLQQLHWLGKKMLADPDWTHGFIIPLFSLYLLYDRRDRLAAARRKTSYLGLVLMPAFLAAEVFCIARLRNYWSYQLCMVALLFAVVLYLGGWSVIRVTWLPILFLAFAMPISPSVYTAMSQPLQALAAKGAVAILRVLGVSIRHIQSNLELVSRSGYTRDLTIAEACSGMRLLMAFMALGVAMAYLDYKPLWQRIVLVVAGVPIAIFCNVIRVSITCWMYYIDKEELGQSFMHFVTGVIMLIPAFALLWLMAWLLRVVPRWVVRILYVEEQDDGDGAGGPEAAPGPAEVTA